jgi:hypothetical protein
VHDLCTIDVGFFTNTSKRPHTHGTTIAFLFPSVQRHDDVQNMFPQKRRRMEMDTWDETKDSEVHLSQWDDKAHHAPLSNPDNLSVEDDAECGVYLESTLCALFPCDAKRLESEQLDKDSNIDIITMEPFTEQDARDGLVRVRFVPGCGARTQLQCYALTTLYEHLRHQNTDIVFTKYRYSQADLDKITALYRLNVQSSATKLRADQKLSTTEYSDKLSEQAAQILSEQQHSAHGGPRFGFGFSGRAYSLSTFALNGGGSGSDSSEHAHVFVSESTPDDVDWADAALALAFENSDDDSITSTQSQSQSHSQTRSQAQTQSPFRSKPPRTRAARLQAQSRPVSRPVPRPSLQRCSEYPLIQIAQMESLYSCMSNVQ